MTGKEAKRLLIRVQTILNTVCLEDNIKAAYHLGSFSEHLNQIIEIDKCSFNSTIKDEDEEDQDED